MAGLLSRLVGLFRPDDQKANALTSIPEFLLRPKSASGIAVSADTALEVTTVFACMQKIANGISQVPFRLYRATGETRTPATDHPLYDVLYRRPNRYQTAYEFRETIAFHVGLTGNAYVFKAMVGRAREVRELLIIEPKRVTVEFERDGVVRGYTIRGDDGSLQFFPPETIWHIRGPSWDARKGLESIRYAREAIGLALATERTHAQFHKNGAKPSGVYSVTGKLGPEEFKKLQDWIIAMTGGENSHRPMVIDNGASFTNASMTGVDAQHLETRRFQIEEVCRAFGVMPIMVGYSDKTATYASAEQMFLAHVVHTLSPWYERLQQSADVNLLSEDERRAGLYFKFNADALMRGASKDRSEYFVKALGNLNSPGWMTPNEVRALEELNPIEGGDDLMKPSAPDAPDPGEETDPSPEPDPPPPEDA